MKKIFVFMFLISCIASSVTNANNDKVLLKYHLQEGQSFSYNCECTVNVHEHQDEIEAVDVTSFFFKINCDVAKKSKRGIYSINVAIEPEKFKHSDPSVEEEGNNLIESLSPLFKSNSIQLIQTSKGDVLQVRKFNNYIINMFQALGFYQTSNFEDEDDDQSVLDDIIWFLEDYLIVNIEEIKSQADMFSRKLTHDYENDAFSQEREDLHNRLQTHIDDILSVEKKRLNIYYDIIDLDEEIDGIVEDMTQEQKSMLHDIRDRCVSLEKRFNNSRSNCPLELAGIMDVMDCCGTVPYPTTPIQVGDVFDAPVSIENDYQNPKYTVTGIDEDRVILSQSMPSIELDDKTISSDTTSIIDAITGIPVSIYSSTTVFDNDKTSQIQTTLSLEE
jgi:hypothetical protein